MLYSKNKIALVDCNSFYVSCERLFDPSITKKPVVVLSSNDGCIISRSTEAKALNIKMGEPYFKVEKIIKKNNVKVFSSNYSLYGDISRRVMKTLKQFSPQIEIYSIDEAFLDLSSILFDPEVRKDWFFSLTKVFITNSSLTLAITVEKFFGFKLLSTTKRSPS